MRGGGYCCVVGCDVGLCGLGGFRVVLCVFCVFLCGGSIVFGAVRIVVIVCAV